MFKCYLAGPITGLTYGESTDWRGYAKKRLANYDINGYSPMRGKKYLDTGKAIGKFNGEFHPLSSDKGIMTRDYNDCRTSDCILMNLLGAEKVSIGTMMEAAFAFAHRVPVILVMESDNVHKHPMLLEAVGYVVDNLDDGLDIVNCLLNP